jgi:hypothetical protein
MPYGEIFIGAFRQLWRHKKLFGFGLLGVLLGTIGSTIYSVFALQWQSNWYRMMSSMMNDPGMMPERLGYQMMTGMTWIWLGLCVMLLFVVIGYVVSLVMRGAIMHEAAIAWRGAATDFSRGVSAGAGRSVYIFLIDLLWFLPPLLLICGGSAVMAMLIGVAAVGATADGYGVGREIGLLFIILPCTLVCLSILIAIFTSLFSPLMYQSAVIGRRSVGESVREGWRLTVGNLGPMLIFWLLFIGLNILLAVVVWLLTLPLMLPWLNSWMTDWMRFSPGFEPGRMGMMPAFNSGWLIVIILISGLLTLLTQGFLLTFRYTMYAEVYRRLTGIAPAVVVPPPTPDAGPVTPAVVIPVDEPIVVVSEEPLPPEPEEPPRV